MTPWFTINLLCVEPIWPRITAFRGWNIQHFYEFSPAGTALIWSTGDG